MLGQKGLDMTLQLNCTENIQKIFSKTDCIPLAQTFLCPDVKGLLSQENDSFSLPSVWVKILPLTISSNIFPPVPFCQDSPAADHHHLQSGWLL